MKIFSSKLVAKSNHQIFVRFTSLEIELEEELNEYDDNDAEHNEPKVENGKHKDKDTHVSRFTASFQDFLLKPELLRAIQY